MAPMQHRIRELVRDNLDLDTGLRGFTRRPRRILRRCNFLHEGSQPGIQRRNFSRDPSQIMKLRDLAAFTDSRT